VGAFQVTLCISRAFDIKALFSLSIKVNYIQNIKKRERKRERKSKESIDLMKKK